MHNADVLYAPGPASCQSLRSKHAQSMNQNCIHFTAPAQSDGAVMLLKCLLEFVDAHLTPPTLLPSILLVMHLNPANTEAHSLDEVSVQNACAS